MKFVGSANLFNYQVKVTEKLRGELFHFTRWFDLIQHLIRREEAGGANINFPLIPINLDYKPHPVCLFSTKIYA
jgi:hypothetical protein